MDTTSVLRPGDAGYPSLLAAIASPPDLDVRGSIEPGDALAVALVGSRRATPYGIEVAERLASELAARGVTIVSGLARGIDGAAHRGAIAAGGRTLAVLGSGVDVLYPPEHHELATDVERHGALVSQFPRGTPPMPRNFPARNRVIAGLALGVVVVEAAERSGALITAGLAGDLGREVFAVPGRLTSETSRGTHRLIQEGAKLVQDWADVVEELPDEWRRLVRTDVAHTSDASPPPDDQTDEGRVLALLKSDEPQHIEDLIVRSGLPAGRTSAVLMGLEIGGWARQLAGQRWLASGARASRVRCGTSRAGERRA
jgi:DNA processing protein